LQSWRHRCQLIKGMLAAFLCSLVASNEHTEYIKSLNAHLLHVGSMDALPVDDLGTIKHEYKCKSEDVAEIAITDITDHKSKIDTCRKVCVQDVSCQAWTIDSLQDRCWLKHSCNGGSKRYGFTSGFVNHASFLQHVTAPAKVALPQLVSVMENTNCWGYDIAEVVIMGSSGVRPLQDAFTFACKDACLNQDECCAWTINMGTGGTQGGGRCWLKKSCDGVSFDVQAKSGLTDCNIKAHKSPSSATTRRQAPAGTPAVTTAVPLGVAKQDVPLVAGIASAAGASAVTIGLLAGLLAPPTNITVIHNKLRSTTKWPNPIITRSSVTIKPKEGQSSGSVFLWCVPLFLGLFLLGCLMRPLAMRWYHLTTGCCCCGQDYDVTKEKEPKNVGPYRGPTFATAKSTSRQQRGALLPTVPPHGMMMVMQVPMIPVVAVPSRGGFLQTPSSPRCSLSQSSSRASSPADSPLSLFRNTLFSEADGNRLVGYKRVSFAS